MTKKDFTILQEAIGNSIGDLRKIKHGNNNFKTVHSLVEKDYESILDDIVDNLMNSNKKIVLVDIQDESDASS